jgi:16S rRNA G966 N2-methylase RsmD
VIHNVDTRTTMHLAVAEVVGNNKRFACNYVPTLPKSMHRLLRYLGNDLNGATTFIDIGCGKGLTLLVASCYPVKSIIGVEFTKRLQEIAHQNIKQYRGPKCCLDLNVLCMDATDFQFPAGPLVIYFFNPFHRSIMEKVLKNLLASLTMDERRATVICDRLHDREIMIECLHPQKTEVVLGFSIYSEFKLEVCERTLN